MNVTDVYTGNSIDEMNVTETQFTFDIQDDVLCPMYEVSAWNSGGQGKMSEQIQGCMPHSELHIFMQKEYTLCSKLAVLVPP